jgi:hypothetical protein
VFGIASNCSAAIRDDIHTDKAAAYHNLVQNSFLYTVVPSKRVNSTLSTSHNPFEIKARPAFCGIALIISATAPKNEIAD